jgi:hypothetical protein
MGDLHSLLLGHRDGVAGGLLLAVLLGLVGWWLGPRLGWSRAWTAFSTAWLGLVLGLAVARSGVHPPSFGGNGAFWSTCRRNPGVTVRTAQDLVNVVMLAPLAFGLTMASRRWWIGLAAATVTIVLVEVGQAMLGTGLCEAGDATRNLVGALVGAAVGWCTVRLTTRLADRRA